MKHIDPKLNTYTMLCMRYVSPVVHLDTIVQDYFKHMDVKTARKKVNFHELPFPAFKIEQSAKAPWMVRLEDFAIYLDQQYALHRHDYDAMNS